MIGQLTGTIIFITSDHFIINVNGVGYIVYGSASLLSSLIINKDAVIITEMIVREDSLTLYGFQSYLEKLLFSTLIKIQGIGAKMSISIMNSANLRKILNAILTSDYKFFTNVNGIGKKMAMRLINELHDSKFLKEIENELNSIDSNANEINLSRNLIIQNEKNIELYKDIVSTLVNLGFPRSKSQIVVKTVMIDNSDCNFEDMLRICLSKINNNI
ncbi:Holliday junction branch migration protein RuvA [Lyticum sinuosum]|uniref:Holliday junction branch migration complex subunit RuvA n=1 Tax=Lyticum sinuosum TaxID=1332059 RepID=A0AAE4VL63_9RICK|nr:Holliday junction branch migration protein RuvA [Lyticum sinuosum]MDZ5761528.1 Holliday junction ATP-dependent DNA helicase RuvA [Lyticum sinuosum]